MVLLVLFCVELFLLATRVHVCTACFVGMHAPLKRARMPANCLASVLLNYRCHLKDLPIEKRDSGGLLRHGSQYMSFKEFFSNYG